MHEERFSLRGIHALITGGGSGLGLGMARSFVEAGANVTIVGRRAEPLQIAAEELGAAVTAVSGDVTDDESRHDIVDKARKAAGPISVLVNNAGIHLKKPLTETNIRDFSAVMDTHLTAGVALSQLTVPDMKAAGNGHLLFIASMVSFIGMPSVVAYSAAKAGVSGIVRSLAVELGPFGVRVNAIAPGWIESPMLHKALDNDTPRRERILARTPLGRFGEAEDIGSAAVYLSSPAGGFVSGVVLPVDGGALVGF